MSKASLGILEISSIAKGYLCTNTVAGEAGIEIVEATFVSPGKFFLLFKGATSDVERALGRVLSPFRPWLLDSALVKGFRDELLKGLYGLLKTQLQGDLLVIETLSMAAALKYSHIAMVNCELSLIEIRSSRGIGGKSVALLTGPVEKVMAAIAEIQSIAKGGDSLVACEMVTNMAPEFKKYFTLS